MACAIPGPRRQEKTATNVNGNLLVAMHVSSFALRRTMGEAGVSMNSVEYLCV